MKTFFKEVRQTLVIALIVMAIIAVTTPVLSRTDPAWVRPS